MNIKIRFGYCPPNPGPKGKPKAIWFTDVDNAIIYAMDNPTKEIYISINGKAYRPISFEKLIELSKGTQLSTHIKKILVKILLKS